jgi:hypothetical protein
MILNRQHFDIKNRCIIEKVIVRTPMRYSRIFPNEACFLRFKSGQLSLASATDKTQITASESVLLNCGNYFADFIQHSSSGISVGLLFLGSVLLRKKLSKKVVSRTIILGSALVIMMMATAIRTHLHPNVPADVLPLKIKPPFIPGFFCSLQLQTYF